MGQIEDLRLFVSVVEEGSISKAADKMNIAKSAVSRRLGLLEERYEAVLVERNPGNWKVTETGRELHRRALRTIAEMDEIEADFINPSATISGPLSVSVPRDFGLGYLSNTLTNFKLSYPEIALSVDFDDRVVDLEQENYDFVIRITRAWDEAPSEGQIGIMKHGLFASPDYLKGGKTPEHLEDLKTRQLINFGRARRATWEFVSDRGKPIMLEFSPYLSTNSGAFLLDNTLKGLGISRMPYFLVGDALAKGELVEVLPDLQMPEWRILLLHSEHRKMNRRMRVFFEEIRKACLDLSHIGADPD